ncbi:MAG: glycosyltransferase [Armatimonadota bacterium]|nr:glycosyltransferase [Armatimonadota bacterium]MDR5697788.1 glycosyltransferase [Armatimonadota bacterium]
MLQRVACKVKSLAAYAAVAGGEVLDEIRDLGRALRGLQLVQVNSAAHGGGVAELLTSMIPLECDVGLDAQWWVIGGAQEFFRVTKGFHNALQGATFDLTDQVQDVYLRHNETCAAELAGPFDVAIVHDPQPAAMRRYSNVDARWVWRCHIDTSSPNAAVWAFLKPYVESYDAAVFTLPKFVPADWVGPSTAFVPPAIDPLSPKNRVLPRHLCREEVAEFGVDLTRPLVIQVSRFDPWKDPQGVIDAYRIVKAQMPEVQLALIGAMADDDPGGWEIYEQIRTEGEGDPDFFLFTNLTGVGAHEVNAFQSVADVAVQKSIREGFGLVVSEALWKRTPVVGGRAGGIPLQIEDGVGGFLVDSVESCADRILYLLTHPDEASLIAQRGWERVRDRFLIPRLVRDELRLVRSLVDRGGSAANEGPKGAAC